MQSKDDGAQNRPPAAGESSFPTPGGQASRKPNLIFISIDDLNDWIEPLGGHPSAVTPSLTQLANIGAVCMAAQVAAPACSPSRTATLLGISPHRSGVYFNSQHWNESPLADNDTLIGYLRKSGYTTYGCGKVFHRWAARLRQSDWDQYYLPDGYMASIKDRNSIISKLAQKRFEKSGRESEEDFGPSSSGENGDKEVTDWAVERLQDPAWKGGGQVLAMGLYRPHLPMVVNQGYFDLYPDEVPLPPGFYPNSTRWRDNRRDLDDLPPTALTLGSKRPGNDLDETGEYQSFLRSYLASISFADFQIGRILEQYDRLGLAENTYIVLWSDHGWQLGEKLKFRKFTLWERALRVPLFFAGPGIQPETRITQPVSLLSVYPTICDLLGLPVPAHCDGVSLAPRLLGRSNGDDLPPVVSFWGNEELDSSFKCYMSVRTADWRLIDYGDDEVELYDHHNDRYEWHNLAPRVGRQTGRSRASARLRAAIKALQGVLPKTSATSLRPSEIQQTIRNLRSYLPTTLAPPAQRTQPQSDELDSDD